MNPNNAYNDFMEAYLQIMSVWNPERALNELDFLDQEDAREAVESSQRTRAVRRNIIQDCHGAAQRLWDDYFSPTPVYPPDYFRRRFRMRRELFTQICQRIHHFSDQQPIPAYFSYFQQTSNALGRLSFNIFQKVTSAIRQLAYGYSADSLDEYLHMGQQTSYDCLENFCKCIFHLYSAEYLRKPTQQDVDRLTAIHAEIHGFPGMLGSIDCMHWPWRNCPTAWQGQYTRDDQGCPTIMLEALASYDLWIWHVYFGTASSNNDINVLNESDLFDELLQDRAPQVTYTIDGEEFTSGYYLADSVYPEWATLVKSFKCPLEEKKLKFKRYQESARKDVERAFGVLQGRWGILKMSARPYNVNKIKRIMYTCVILHNKIVEDNGRAMCELEDDYLANPHNYPEWSWNERVATVQRMTLELRDIREHHRL